MNKNSIFAIFEVGTNNFKEIRRLSYLLQPHQVIITNILPTHLENFCSTKNIAKEKSDLINPKYNHNIELAVLSNSNKDEAFIVKIAKKYLIKSIITFGKNKNSNYTIKKINKIHNFLSNVVVKTPIKEINFKISTSFEHQIYNTLISLIIYNYHNLNLKNFINRLSNLPVVQGRGLFCDIMINNKKIKLIDESYNASPASMINCINYFNNFKKKLSQRKFIILGEMFELGKFSKKFHEKIIIEVINTSIDYIIFCGSKYQMLLKKSIIKQNRIFYFNSELKIINFLNKKVLKNDIILAKGSNSSKINILVNLLMKKGKV